MAESAVLTPLSVRHAMSPRGGSPGGAAVCTVSSPTEQTVDVDGTMTPPSPSQAPPHRTEAAARETLSDAEDGQPPQQQGQQEVRDEREAHITAADYSDRQRLLYHITYLSTQLQRAQLQVEDLTRVVCVLRGTAAGDAAGVAAVKAALKADATSAAVLAARDEKDVHAALQASLAVFDPVIAQAQIYRLDDALAQIGLLREAELAQLRKKSAALLDHRALLSRLSSEVEQLRSKTAALEQYKQNAETQLSAARLEVEQLRYEERRLNQRVSGMEQLAQEGTWMSNVRVVGAAPAVPLDAGGSPAPPQQQQQQLVREEQVARQALLLDIFWDPMLIAFDAGLTWLSDSAALQARDAGAEAASDQPVARVGPGVVKGGSAGADERDLVSLAQAGILVDTPAPPTDADLLLLRRQQEEVAQLRARVHLLQERHRVAQLDTERVQSLYEGEVRRSERMAHDHAAQLQQAYDEVVRDRQCIMHKLKQEVEDQIRLAFEDGRAYERSSARSRSRPVPHSTQRY
ncbi:hypothetical protein NESM_000648400 [Novymonas esmeraldas]|uniref:Uncharacterized protein n=1 Tax=Novymonas esmeraldas TaxID=1808958 RepID=A0AAW0EVD9_9TRYP